MKEEQYQLLRLAGQLPARLTVEQVACFINCQPHDIPVLVAARLLKPLGNPANNAVKFFATVEVLERVKDQVWLAKVTNAISGNWRKQNAAKGNGGGSSGFDQRLAQSGQNSG